MEAPAREQLVQAINILRSMLEEYGDEAVDVMESKMTHGSIPLPPLTEIASGDVVDATFHRVSMNGKMSEVKAEKRIEIDEMEDPPISAEITWDLCECVINLVQDEGQRGNPIQCVIVGEYTGVLGSAVSESFGGAGGRVLCIGDCLDQDGGIKPDWADHVGEKLGKTIWPVKGDITENYQGMDRLLDIVVISTCGAYHEMASMISRWAGLLRAGGVICGTQHDEGHYPASVAAIEEVFTPDRVMKNDSSFWCVKTGKTPL